MSGVVVVSVTVVTLAAAAVSTFCPRPLGQRDVVEARAVSQLALLDRHRGPRSWIGTARAGDRAASGCSTTTSTTSDRATTTSSRTSRSDTTASTVRSISLYCSLPLRSVFVHRKTLFKDRIKRTCNQLVAYHTFVSTSFLPRDAKRRLSVCHKPVLYRKDWTNRAGFWHGGFLPRTPHCVLRKFGYLQKLGYFPLVYFILNSGVRQFRRGTRRRRRVRTVK